MKKFTVSEVRVSAFGLSEDNLKPEAAMLHDYADRLEADEKAVPVVWVNPDDLANPYFVGIGAAKAAHQDLGRHYTQPLYSRPSPADAERLAEALRELVAACEEHDAMVSRIIGHPAGWNAQYLNSARQALAAHSAQAQPPAASVTDPVFPSHRACVPYENHPGKRIVGFVIDESHPWWGKCGLTEPLSALEAALAAQENPNGL